MKLQLKRGLDAGRTFTPAVGEPLWTTDTKKLYIGDGTTVGGIAVDTSPVSSVFGRTGAITAQVGDYSSFYLGINATAAAATKLATGRTLSITGDLAWTSPAFDGTANVTAVGTLASIITSGGPTGSASVVPVITWDAKGRLTAVSTATITPAAIGAQVAGSYQPLENQRLSTGNWPVFAGINTTGDVISGAIVRGASAVFNGSVTAGSFVKAGGTSSQFLKADGTVDSTSYATASSLGNYLGLTAQASDSAKLGGQLPSYYALEGTIAYTGTGAVDPNTLTNLQSGYTQNTAANRPGNYAFVQTLGRYNGGSMQIASDSYGSDSNSLWWRRRGDNGTWYPWKTIWHTGNLTGDQTGHYHSADRAWANLTGVPFKFQNYPGNSAYEGFWPSGVSPTANNYGIVWKKDGDDLSLNAGTSLIFRTVDSNGVRQARLTVQDDGITASVPFNGTSATFSSDVTINGAISGSGNLIRNTGYVQAVGANQANLRGVDGSTETGWNSVELSRGYSANAVNRRMTYGYYLPDKGMAMRVESTQAYGNDITWKLLNGSGTRASDGWATENVLLSVGGTGAVFNGSVTAGSFIKAGGGSGFLKADGTVDNTTYLSAGSFQPLNANLTALSTGQTNALVVANNVSVNNYFSDATAGDTIFRWGAPYTEKVRFGIMSTSAGSNASSLWFSASAAGSNYSFTASSFVKSGGTSAQFLKADGSVDGTSYATSASLANYLPLAGGTLSGNLLGSVSYNIGASANWWGSGYFTSLYVQNNAVWHAGNLTGNQTAHYHASDRAWSNLTGVPFQFQNYPGAPTICEGFWPTGVTPTDANFSILWNKDNAQTYISASDQLNFQTIGAGGNRENRMVITDTAITASVPITGTTATMGVAAMGASAYDSNMAWFGRAGYNSTSFGKGFLTNGQNAWVCALPGDAVNLRVGNINVVNCQAAAVNINVKLWGQDASFGSTVDAITSVKGGAAKIGTSNVFSGWAWMGMNAVNEGNYGVHTDGNSLALIANNNNSMYLYSGGTAMVTISSTGVDLPYLKTLKFSAIVTIGSGTALPVVAPGEVVMLVGASTGSVTNTPVTNASQTCKYRTSSGAQALAAARGATVNFDLYGGVAFLVGRTTGSATLLS